MQLFVSANYLCGRFAVETGTAKIYQVHISSSCTARNAEHQISRFYITVDDVSGVHVFESFELYVRCVKRVDQIKGDIPAIWFMMESSGKSEKYLKWLESGLACLLLK